MSHLIVQTMPWRNLILGRMKEYERKNCGLNNVQYRILLNNMSVHSYSRIAVNWISIFPIYSFQFEFLNSGLMNSIRQILLIVNSIFRIVLPLKHLQLEKTSIPLKFEWKRFDCTYLHAWRVSKWKRIITLFILANSCIFGIFCKFWTIKCSTRLA